MLLTSVDEDDGGRGGCWPYRLLSVVLSCSFIPLFLIMALLRFLNPFFSPHNVYMILAFLTSTLSYSRHFPFSSSHCFLRPRGTSFTATSLDFILFYFIGFNLPNPNMLNNTSVLLTVSFLFSLKCAYWYN